MLLAFVVTLMKTILLKQRMGYMFLFISFVFLFQKGLICNMNIRSVLAIFSHILYLLVVYVWFIAVVYAVVE